MDLLLLLGANNQKFRELMFASSALGVNIEDFVDNKVKLLSDDPMYTVKFSTPEFYELNILGDGQDVHVEDVRREFKNMLNSSMVELWKKNDDEGFDDEFYEECLSYIQYMCRVRKGEVWTAKMRDAAVESVRQQYAQIDAYVQRNSEYNEV